MGGTVQSPWVYAAIDQNNNQIRAEFNFNVNTRILQKLDVFRDAACLYTKVLIGKGADGTPDSTPFVVPVPAGTTTLTSTQLASLGFTTIDQVWALQITAQF